MPKPRLCEIIAVLGGKRGAVQKSVTDVYHQLQKTELFDGLQRTYKPRVEGGETLPPEAKNPQLKVSDLVTNAINDWTELFDLSLTLDYGNCQALGEITLPADRFTDVPVSTLLFLQKQLIDVQTFITKLPTLDPAETWSYDAGQDTYRTPMHATARTKKVERMEIVVQPTIQHPAQTKLFTEDVVVGDWTAIKYSTRLTQKDKNDMLTRVRTVIDAVKTARERANTIEVEQRKIGAQLLAFIFGRTAEEKK